ncbi:MAG: GNAT family N-acetyltransferase, partial [Acidimicrobiales bacterium]|nr:GNAT family N-acetyltransferase [Acidimicrobiales bacterium]
MDIDAAPLLIGDGVRLRGPSEDDVRRRASLGRSREIVRAFGGTLEHDEPMSEEDAEIQLRWRFGAGPHWVIADEEDVFLGVARLAPIDSENRAGRFNIGILDPDRLGQGLGTEATRMALGYGF